MQFKIQVENFVLTQQKNSDDGPIHASLLRKELLVNSVALRLSLRDQFIMQCHVSIPVASEIWTGGPVRVRHVLVFPVWNSDHFQTVLTERFAKTLRVRYERRQFHIE